MGRITEFREKFEDIIEDVLEQDLCNVDAHELGEVVDCLKDIFQCEYYYSVISAMQENTDSISNDVRDRMYYHDPKTETVEEIETMINSIADNLDTTEKSKMKQQLLNSINRL